MLLPHPDINPNRPMPYVGRPTARGIEAAIQLRTLNYQKVEGDREIYWDNSQRPRYEQPPYCMLQCSLSGEGFFEADGQRHRLSPGRAFLVPVPSPTIYGLPFGDDWSWFWIGFEGPVAFQVVESFNEAFGYLFEFREASSALRHAIALVEDCLRGTEQSHWHLSSRLYSLLMELFEECAGQDRKHPDAVEAAIAYMERNWSDGLLGLQRLADAVGLSKYHFARIFKEATGQSPGEYLRAMRMEQAMNLLRFSDLPVKEIAYQCGFNSDIHFCSMFKKRYGITPGSLRR